VVVVGTEVVATGSVETTVVEGASVVGVAV
jgi:hypothetical protein